MGSWNFYIELRADKSTLDNSPNRVTVDTNKPYITFTPQ